MTQHDIIDYIDQFLADHQGFLSGQIVDFALDVRSFVNELDSDDRKLAEVA